MSCRVAGQVLACSPCCCFNKSGQHQPLNRQAERFARQGVPLGLSTLADQVGAATFALMPLYRRIEVLAKGKTDIGRLWVYVRDDRPFGGADPPAALFHYSRDRRGEHPRAHLDTWSSILQAHAYGGYGELYAADRRPGPVLEAGCLPMRAASSSNLPMSRDQRATRAAANGQGRSTPIALEAVQRLDVLFDIEREINGLSAEARACARREQSAPLMEDLHAWLIVQLAKLSRNHDLAKAMKYMLRRLPAFTRFLGDAESALRTMRLNGPCAASRSVARPGCSAGRIAAASALLSSTPSSAPPNSMMSTRKPGLPMCLHASQSTTPTASTSCCR